MESEQTQTPQVEDTRRAAIEEGFNAAERNEPVVAEGRDEKGRFTGAEPEAKVEEAEPPVWRRPPASWKKDYHEVWQKADPKMQEYAWQREEQMRRGVEPLLSKAQFADQMNEAIQPYMQTIQGLGLTPDKAVAALMEADHKLRNSDPQSKLQYFMQLAQSYGINLGQQASQNPSQPTQSVDPMVWQLQNELNRVRGEVMGWKQQQEMVENQTLLNEINSFSLKAEHFDEVRPAMIQLLQGGMAETLEEAYDKALRLNPDLFDRVQKAKQAEITQQQAQQANRAAKVARSAAVSVRSAAPGANTAPKAATRRALLEEMISENEARL